LLAVELAYRRQAGEVPAVDEYCGRFREHVRLVADAFREEIPPPPRLPTFPLPGWLVHGLEQEQSVRPKVERQDHAEALRPTGSNEPNTVPQSPGSSEKNSRSGPVLLLGDYQLLEKIGQGGMGVVYRARQRGADRIVALKVIRPDRLNDLLSEERREWLERFRREGQLAARLEHESIVAVYDVDEIDGQAYYAMRYVEGQSLAALLRERPLANPQAAALLETVARAVHFAHERDVFHRDLTPRNILLDAQERPFVTDFGLAKWLGAPCEMTPTGEPMGVPSFMSPEQARDASRITAASDVYSLGAILYTMLTGRPPFQAATPLETLRQVQDNEPSGPRQLNPAVDRDLETITLKCLHKEPARRYASAQELADDLRRYCRHEPIRARPVGPLGRLRRWRRRNPALAAAIAGVILALVTGIIASSSFATVAHNRSEHLRDALGESEIRRRQAAELALGLGLHLCEQGDSGLGILWLARSLETAPESADDLQRVIRANLAGWGNALRPLLALQETPSEVLALAYSPDGKWAAIATDDGAVWLCDAATGQPVGAPLRHQQTVQAVSFSPDSRTVLTGSWDKTACLWDVATRQAVTLPHPDAVWALAFSQDGKTILTAAGEPVVAGVQKPQRGEARLWNAATGKPLHVFPHGAPVYAVALSGNGRIALTGSADGKARLWDSATGSLLHILEHRGPVCTVALSPDGKTALTGSFDHTAGLWDVATGLPLATLAQTAEVTAVAFSPDGKIVLTGSHNHTAQLWETQRGVPLVGATLPHNSEVLAVAFSPDGKSFLTGSKDGTARLWDAITRKSLGPPLLHHGEISAVAFSPDGRTALIGSQHLTAHRGEARFWDLTPRYAATTPGHQARVSALALSPDGKLALTGGDDGLASMWEIATGRRVGVPLALGAKVQAVAFGPENKTVLMATAGGRARWWDVATGKALAPEMHWGELIQTLACSPDGRMVLTGGEGKVQRWEAATGNPVGEPLLHATSVWSVAFAPDGKTALAGCADGLARRWDLASGELLGPALGPGSEKSLPSHEALMALALSPDGHTALIASIAGRARFWDVATGRPIGPPLWHHDRIQAVAFSSDGKTALTASKKEVRRWAVPVPMDGDVRRVVLWSHTATGMELDAGGGVQLLDAPTWQERRRCLHQPADSPGP
jgi:WD40 repeat protein/serine/threonine protein kinase